MTVKVIDCPSCKMHVSVFWESFCGTGKKCPGCGGIIYLDYINKKLRVRKIYK